jgi:site-specific DNA-methyltransferase (adenine-specific)
MRAVRRGTSTSNFGAGGRESHDASGFYRRFSPPEISTDDTVLVPAPVADPFVHGDARDMSAVADGSVALVVTSPPYFAGKQYEEEMEREGIPASYLEYLDMLAEVFAECLRALEPGGRIAVNVANLGRKPYRSLAADVIRILQDDLGFLLRGEVVWQKAAGASGSCAWGSYRSAVNPVLRDVTERVVVASKGRFDRARSVERRRAEGLPHESTVGAEDFMTLTLDTWSIPAESARRVGHPAPFPVELPAQLIRLHTFRNDLVLDPFMGSGSTLVAAALLDRRYIGYDLDAGYVDMARRRVAEAIADVSTREHAAGPDGDTALRLAELALGDAGFTITGRNRRVPQTGVTVGFVAEDDARGVWRFEVCGPNTTYRGGMAKVDVAWRALGRAAAIGGAHDAHGVPLVLLTTALPASGEAVTALRAAGPGAFFDVIDLASDDDADRLQRYAKGGYTADPQPGFWTDAELGRPAH